MSACVGFWSGYGVFFFFVGSGELNLEEPSERYHDCAGEAFDFAAVKMRYDVSKKASSRS